MRSSAGWRRYRMGGLRFSILLFHMPPVINTIRRHVVFPVALLMAGFLAGCAAPSSRVVSPGPMYSGAAQVDRVSVYVFIDTRPEYVHPEFRKVFEQALSSAFDAAATPSQQTWFMDTDEGRRLQADVKSHTLGNVTFVSVGKTIFENRASDARFRPTHYLVAFPRDAYKSGDGAILDIKWDILDATNGNVEWSVFTRTPVLSGEMRAEDAAQAARGLVETITKEMQARAVLHP